MLPPSAAPPPGALRLLVLDVGQGLAAHAAEIVQQRHEDGRRVLMTGAQVVQVLAELQDAAQEELAHLLVGVAGFRALQNPAQALHLFQQKTRAVVLQHLEHAVQTLKPVVPLQDHHLA